MAKVDNITIQWRSGLIVSTAFYGLPSTQDTARTFLERFITEAGIKSEVRVEHLDQRFMGGCIPHIEGTYFVGVSFEDEPRAIRWLEKELSARCPAKSRGAGW